MTSTPVEILPMGHRLRQSTINTAGTCLKRVEFMIEHPTHWGGGTSRGLGTAYHAIEEDWYDPETGSGSHSFGELDPLETATMAMANERKRVNAEDWKDDAQKPIPHKDSPFLGHELFDPELYMPLGTPQRADRDPLDTDQAIVLATNLALYSLEANQWSAEEYEVIAVEWFFEMPFHHWTAIGSVDLILRHRASGWFIIVDHKTANKPWAKGKGGARGTVQPPWYTYWFKKWWLEQTGEIANVMFMFDVMSLDGRRTVKDATPNQKTIDIVMEKKATELMRLIEQGGPFPPNTDSNLCHRKWCDWWDLCDYGEGYG